MLLRIKHKCKKLALLLKPKIKLDNNTVVINKNTWNNFDASSFNNSVLNYVEITDFRQISPKDYDKIQAVIGGISNAAYLKHLKNLSWFQLASHGHNGYENKALYSNPNVIVTNLTNIFSKPMAEYAITAYYLFHSYAFRKIINHDINPANVPAMKNNITVMIYGLGNIGKEVAMMCKNQGWTVWGVKRQLSSQPDFVDELFDFENSKKHLANVDYVINILPETKETQAVFNEDFFKYMKKDSIFANLGRASAVVDVSLDNAVKNGIIGGAVLDASSNYKFKHPNIIKTGHTSSVSMETKELFNDFFTKQLNAYITDGIENVDNIITMK